MQTALERTARHWGRITRSGDPEAYVRRAIYSAHERLRGLADELPSPRTSHPSAAQAAWAARRRPLRRAWVPAVAVCAVAAVLLLVAVAPTSGLRRGTPVSPAGGPGALPVRLFTPPAWTPLVTEAPVERAAYVLATAHARRGPFSRGTAPVVVSADGGAYRVLPWREGDHGLSLSPDGRRVAWVRGAAGGPDTPTRVVVLTLATGELVAQPDSAQVPTVAEGTSWSTDGRSVLVWGADYVSSDPNGPGGKANGYLLDASTLRVLSMREGLSGPALLDGTRVVRMDAVRNATTVSQIDGDVPIVLSPDGGRVAASVQRGVGPGDGSGQSPEDAMPRLVVANVGGRTVLDLPLADGAFAQALGWSGQGLAVAVYGAAWRDIRPRVALVDPATGRETQTLTLLPVVSDPDVAVDLDPQVVAVAADVLAGGRTAATPPPRWDWWSGEHLRWWLSAPLAVALELGLGLAAVLLVRLAVRRARADRDARR